MAKLRAPLLLWALVHLTCANPVDSNQRSTSGFHLDPEDKLPAQPPRKRALRPSSDFLRRLQDTPSTDFDGTSLEWKWWDGSLPDGAVSIYNSYSSRVDYICKVGCHSGYYDSTLDNAACAYASDGAGYSSTQFEVLVNKDDFEILEWKEGYDGSVTPNSIKTCANDDIYIGKNKFGLGEVKVSEKGFNLPWGGSRYWYSSYMVLETMKDVRREHLMDVKYKTEGVKPIEYPPEILNRNTISNAQCQPIKQEVTLSKSVTSTQKWEINFALTVGVGTTIETGIPFIAQGKIDLRASFTYRLNKESSYSETTTHSLTLETTVPAGHSCTIKMQGKKYGLDVPYTARLKRIYRNGETKWTTITGTFKGVQISEVHAEMERCQPLPDVKPC
ncbi:natterin-3-like [Hippocampus comes]|uniref:Natterin-3-like n=1 Tax=Hippocampus comes TaxID=109280 RepID=A0A3Q2Z0C2_HIPCM|nr:PREDICTED: natterin-3-like [Hippocampus comes]XP_019740214.1 PREDICTED: natterin-3-like [Hippocampus comes]